VHESQRTTFPISAGSICLPSAYDVITTQAHPAYHLAIRVDPGVYPVVGYVQWSGSGWRLETLMAPAQGRVVDAHDVQRQVPAVGDLAWTGIHIPISGLSQVHSLADYLRLLPAIRRVEVALPSGPGWQLELATSG
jgi:hypothetical protein